MRARELFSVEERAARFVWRYTGPWQTAHHEIGAVVIQNRYRRRPHPAFVRLHVAGHDLWTHALWREAFRPLVVKVLRAVSRVTP